MGVMRNVFVRASLTLRSEEGIGMIQVIMLGAFLSLMALYLTSSSTSFSKSMSRLRARDQYVTGRNLEKYMLANGRFPDPSPSPP